MKKTGTIIFLLLVLAGTAYYAYQKYNQKSVDPWQVVPSSALIAYENSHLTQNWNGLLKKPIWHSLQHIPLFAQWKQGLSYADSLTGKSGALDKLFHNKKFIISAHVTQADDFDFLFILDVGGETGRENFRSVIRGIQKDHSVIAKSRVYLGQPIQELVSKTDHRTFTYFMYENIAVGSYTSFLVEDAVRNIVDDFQDNFKQKVPALWQITKLDNDDGNLYVDIDRLSELTAVFTESNNGEHDFADDMFFDIKITEHELLFNGSSAIDPRKHKTYLGTFSHQNPQKDGVVKLLPANTALFYHATFSNFSEWRQQLTKLWSARQRDQFDRAIDFDQQYDLDYTWIAGEAACAILETPDRERPDRLAFLQVNNGQKSMTTILSFAKKLSSQQGDTVYSEMYRDQPIVQIPFPDFPGLLAGRFFNGFDNSFITLYRHYLVIGNSMQVVKDFLNAQEDEATWGKSVRDNLFLENTLSEANFSVMVNTEYFWPGLMSRLKPAWKKVFETLEPQLKSFDLIAWQASNLDGRFYTSIAIGHQPKKERKPQDNTIFQKEQSAYTLGPIITKPYIVKNHNNNRFEVLVQDSVNILYLISNEGEILWGDSIMAPIISDIIQIDYYKNKKLQYLFATKNKIHLLDRNGNYVENYPVELNSKVNIHSLSVVDYDNSKRYRIMAADSNGDIFLLDKTGKLLDGWKPRPMEGPQAIPPFHLRVKGGDCMISLQPDGIINVMNRRGKMYPGFPVDLQARGTHNMFVDIGNDFSTTRLITVSEEGEIIEVNLKGKVLKKQQLYKPGKESKFKLVNDALGKTFVIIRQEYSKISVLDRKGNIILEKNLISSQDLHFQYYNFSTDNKVLVVVDREQEFTYLFDKSGHQIGFEPIENGLPVGLLYSGKKHEYLLYSCYKNNFSVRSFK